MGIWKNSLQEFCWTEFQVFASIVHLKRLTI